MKDGVCPKCGSNEVMGAVPIADRGHANGIHDLLSAVIDEEPNAIIFNQLKTFRINAWVCANCGYTELYTVKPRELKESLEKFLAKAKPLGKK